MRKPGKQRTMIAKDPVREGMPMTTLVIPTEAPAVPGPPQGQWTYADWEALPDDGNRYEILDCEMLDLASRRAAERYF